MGAPVGRTESTPFQPDLNVNTLASLQKTDPKTDLSEVWNIWVVTTTICGTPGVGITNVGSRWMSQIIVHWKRASNALATDVKSEQASGKLTKLNDLVFERLGNRPIVQFGDERQGLLELFSGFQEGGSLVNPANTNK